MALKRMRESLDLYGHHQPALFYTDNIADKKFLETSFPSLCQDVVAIEKYAHLDRLTIPSDVYVLVKNNAQAIEDAVRTIMDSLSQDGNDSVYVGFDSEWNVNVSQQGFVTGRGQTAIIQIAYKDVIYILQVCNFKMEQIYLTMS